MRGGAAKILLKFRRKVADFEELSLRARYARVIPAATWQEEAASAVRPPRMPKRATTCHGQSSDMLDPEDSGSDVEWAPLVSCA